MTVDYWLTIHISHSLVHIYSHFMKMRKLKSDVDNCEFIVKFFESPAIVALKVAMALQTYIGSEHV